MEVYTDGACKGNPGKGGWGVFWRDDSIHELYGGEWNTTNNRMELSAIIKALEYFCKLDKPEIIIYTDSQYAFKGITQWMTKWKQKGWYNSKKEMVLNVDLWKKIDEMMYPGVHIRWIKAHDGNVGNENADRLANLGCAVINDE